MKKYFSKFATIFVLMLAVTFSGAAQFVINVRPPAPVIRVRPLAPGPRHVWVSGEYAWRGGRYEYVDGYWAVPPPRRAHWVEGRWRHRRGGWIWVPGHWR